MVAVAVVMNPESTCLGIAVAWRWSAMVVMREMSEF